MKHRIYKSKATVYIYILIGMICYLMGTVAKGDSFDMFLQEVFVVIFTYILTSVAFIFAIIEIYRTYIRREHVLIGDMGIQGGTGESPVISWVSVAKLQFVTAPGAVILIVMGNNGEEIGRFKSLRCRVDKLKEIRSDIEREFVPVEIM